MSTVFPYGPISAYAEEPACNRRAVQRDEAYLRVRGGTDDAAATRVVEQGLSPRTRRNRLASQNGRIDFGPISAYAEEPPRGAGRTEPETAYFRLRGGTSSRQSLESLPYGLSPRTRRNQTVKLDAVVLARPISAYAEEPTRTVRSSVNCGAYLRVRGGTAGDRGLGQRRQGLSPRTLRDRASQLLDIGPRGPISAYTEEPGVGAAKRDHPGAYLRVRRGTRV